MVPAASCLFGSRRRPGGRGLQGRSRASLFASAVALGLLLASPLAAKSPVDIPYYLPVDLSQLDIAIETTEVGSVSRSLPADEHAPVTWTFTRSVSLERTGALALKTVADPAAKREFRIPKASLSDVKATVELTESGILAAINTSAAGRGDDLLLAVAKFAGVAAGFWTGAPVAGLAYATRASQMHAMAHTPPIPGFPAPALCPPIDQLEVEGVPVEMQAFVSLEPAGCAAFLRHREATATVEAMRIARDQMAAELPGASGSDLTELNRRLASFRTEVAYAEAVQAERRATLAALYDTFAGDRCLGKSVGRKTMRELVTLDRLPSANKLGWLAPDADLSRAAAAKALEDGGWREMHDLFARTGVVATLDDAPAAAPPKLDEHGEPLPAAAESEIAWRQAVPVRVRLWTLAGAKESTAQTGNGADACAPHASDSGEDPDAKAKVQLAFDGVLDVLHPASPVRTLPVEAKAFSDRSLAVAFDLRGRPRKIDTSGGSAAAGFAQAAAAAAQGFRDEYDATLKKRVSIEESKRELALDELNDEIAALEAEKEKLDARAELLGAAGSFDDVVARQKLDSELKLLEAQVALRMAEATAEQRVAIAELEKRVLETQKRLALLEAEQELALARGER